MNPTIDWRSIGGSEAIVLTFTGEFTEAGAQLAAPRVAAELIGREAVTMIWECSAMTNYEGGARRIWQQLLKDNRGAIGRIWLVSESLLIRSGASFIGMFTGYEITAVAHIREIQR